VQWLVAEEASLDFCFFLSRKRRVKKDSMCVWYYFEQLLKIINIMSYLANVINFINAI
jgi:hypothetical protein